MPEEEEERKPLLPADRRCELFRWRSLRASTQLGRAGLNGRQRRSVESLEFARNRSVPQKLTHFSGGGWP